MNHGYHGITHREDGYGWVLQIKLRGSYRIIRTYAVDAETAARRHDVALHKLFAYADPKATPNFPEDFPPAPIDTNHAPKDLSLFLEALSTVSAQLLDELRVVGQDYDDLEAARRGMIEQNIEKAKQKIRNERTAAAAMVCRLQDRLAKLELPTTERTTANSLLNRLHQLFTQ